MNTVRNQFRTLVIALLLGTFLLSACGPSVPRSQAEQELGSFMLDFVVKTIGATADYINTSGQPWTKAPPDANIIVWAPAVDKFDSNSINYLNTDAPLRVWWFANNRLTEVTSDKLAAIQDYRKTHMQGTPNDQGPWGWGYYEYGIISLTGGNQDAKVYVGISCGPLCGTGTIYTLHRNASGQWEIKDQENRWIS